MGFEAKAGFLGLVTNTAEIQAPPGALLRAENVVIRRAGACEQRPAVVPHAHVTASPIAAVVKLVPYKAGELMVYDANISDARYRDVQADAAVQYVDPTGATVNPAFYRRDLVASAEARGNLYVGYAGGVLKWQGAGNFITAGVPLRFVGRQNALLNVAATNWLATGHHVAYRLVGVKTDANGLITRSKPTGAFYVVNDTGGDRTPQLSIRLLNPSDQFDSIEIYRTNALPSSVTLNEEYRLVGTLDSWSTGTPNFTDETPDSARGVTLYTSPSREGIEGANDRPPACGVAALFRRSLFFGNVTTQATVALSFNSADRTGGADSGIGLRTISTTTNNTNTATVATSVGLRRGMLVTGAGFPAGTYITNISGTTITYSSSSSTSATASASYLDTIEIDGVRYAAYFSTAFIPISALETVRQAVRSSAYLLTPPKGGYNTTLVVEGVERNHTLTIKATHGNEYDPPLPEWTGTAQDFDPEAKPNVVMWSKPDEPEHVPIANFAFVGDKNSEILALAPTRDALFIFKEDGIWRLTGDNGRWRIDPFDPTTRCVLPCSVQPLNNRVYALTNKGIVVVSDEGVQIVSQPISEQLKPMIHALTVLGSFGAGYYVLRGFFETLGFCAAVNERDSEYLLAVGDMLENERSGVRGLLVYNETTRAITSWKFAEGSSENATNVSALAWQPRQSTLLIGQHTHAQFVRALMAPDATSPGFGLRLANDGEWSRTISSVAAQVATFSAPHELATGDVVAISGNIHRVSAVLNPTQVTLAPPPPPGTTGSVYCVRPIVCTVEPRGFMSPHIVTKQWTHFLAEFSELRGAVSAVSGIKSSVIALPAFLEQPFTVARLGALTAYTAGAALRALVPKDAARGWAVHAFVQWSMIAGHSALEAISAEFVEGDPNRPNLAVRAS